MRTILDFYKPKVVVASSPTTTAKNEKVTLCTNCIALEGHNAVLNSIRRHDIKHSITLTLDFKKKHINKYEDDRELHRHVNQMVTSSKYFKQINYIIRPEYDDNGRLHYHSILWGDCDALVANAVKWWKRYFGFVSPKWHRDIKYYKCFDSVDDIIDKSKCKATTDKVKACAVHYLFKDYKKVKLFTIFKY